MSPPHSPLALRVQSPAREAGGQSHDQSPQRSYSPPLWASPGRVAIRPITRETDQERYDALIEAFTKLNAKKSRDKTLKQYWQMKPMRATEETKSGQQKGGTSPEKVEVTGTRKLEPDKPKEYKPPAEVEEIARSTTNAHQLALELVQKAHSFDASSPEKGYHIKVYLETIVEQQELLKDQAAKMQTALAEIRDTKISIDMVEKGTKDTEQLIVALENMRKGHRVVPMRDQKCKASSMYPADDFIEIRKSDFDMLNRKWGSHKRLWEHAAKWKMEMQNTIEDVVSMAASATLYNGWTAANVLASGGIDTTGISRDRLRKDSIGIYNARKPNPVNDPRYPAHLWCSVTKRFWLATDVKNAHIIPASTSPDTVRHVFHECNHAVVLNCARNFLLLHKNIEAAFDKGQITIVPKSGTQEFRVVFLDRGLLYGKKEMGRTSVNVEDVIYWTDIAASPNLEFRSAHRPGHRNLFYHCVMSLITAKKNHFDGYPFVIAEFAQKRIWSAEDVREWIDDEFLRKWAETSAVPQLYRSDSTIKNDQVAMRLEKEIAIVNTCYLIKQEVEEEEEEVDPEGCLPDERDQSDDEKDAALDEDDEFDLFFPDELRSPAALLPTVPVAAPEPGATC